MADEQPNTSRRPSGKRFKQQKLPAWQPVLTPKTVLPVFILVGIIFIPLGIAFLVASQKVKEITVDYTYCTSFEDPTKSCAEIVRADPTVACTCRVEFTASEGFDDTTFMYYALSNFFQNHRRYVKSRDDVQLMGSSTSSVSEDCDPLKFNGSFPLAPCGLIANSLFNDTIVLKEGPGFSDDVSLIATGIAWSSDVENKFKNPPPQDDLEEAFKNTEKPPNWPVPIYEIETIHPNGPGYKNEDFIVWMRTAALPNFRKLYRKLSSPLSAKAYRLDINYRYPVTAFDGEKKVVFSTTSWLGGKNDFLGITYIVIGCLSLALGIAFLAKHMISPRALGDPKYLQWDVSN